METNIWLRQQRLELLCLFLGLLADSLRAGREEAGRFPGGAPLDTSPH